MIHVCPECGYNDVIEDNVISGHKEVINMTDKEDRWEDEKYIVDILRYCNVWRTKEVDDGIMEVISCIRSEAKAEALREAAERVDSKRIDLHDSQRGTRTEVYADGYNTGLKDAIAAIIADKPKKEQK